MREGRIKTERTRREERGREIIKARKGQNITQQKLEELSGVKRPAIARMENMATNPKIDAVMRVLVPLGETLAVVPIERR